jgi:methylated-DNA-protein-cysteine methyltransferase-like protein
MPKRTRGDDEILRFMTESYRRIFDVVVRIPRGKVMTYGEVAEAAGMRGAARIVGYAMHALNQRVPWQRVMGRRRTDQAHVTIKDAIVGAEQRRLLEAEGVVFSAGGSVDLLRYGHRPKSRKPVDKSRKH